MERVESRHQREREAKQGSKPEPGHGTCKADRPGSSDKGTSWTGGRRASKARESKERRTESEEGRGKEPGPGTERSKARKCQAGEEECREVPQRGTAPGTGSRRPSSKEYTEQVPSTSKARQSSGMRSQSRERNS